VIAAQAGGTGGKERHLNIRGFVLGVILLAAVGWCMVQETVKQTQARYELAELARVEEESRRRLAILRTEEQELRSPARLAALVREKRLSLVSLGSAMPDGPDAASGRRPGEILDDAPSGAARPVDMASTERR
jgi:hypothetical protein